MLFWQQIESRLQSYDRWQMKQSDTAGLLQLSSLLWRSIQAFPVYMGTLHCLKWVNSFKNTCVHTGPFLEIFSPTQGITRSGERTKKCYCYSSRPVSGAKQVVWHCSYKVSSNRKTSMVNSKAWVESFCVEWQRRPASFLLVSSLTLLCTMRLSS